MRQKKFKLMKRRGNNKLKQGERVSIKEVSTPTKVVNENLEEKSIIQEEQEIIPEQRGWHTSTRKYVTLGSNIKWSEYTRVAARTRR